MDLPSPRDVGRFLLDLALPPFCGLCGPLVEDGELEGLCDPCASGLPLEDAARQCRVCARPLHPLMRPRGRCLVCARRRPGFERMTALGAYDGRLRALLGRLKYGRESALARPVAVLLEIQQAALAQADPSAAVDLVVPVPLDRDRRRWRGFNQAEELARRLPDALGAAWSPRALSRRRGGGVQVGRTAAERRRLASSLFRAAEPRVVGRRVLLVDDVVTTGATARAASRALLEGGARSVRVAVAARWEA